MKKGIKRGLLLVAHGSRREASNAEVRQLADLVADQVKGRNMVDCAFLELASPSIPEGLKCMILSGIEDIVVLPYFLSAGRHVVEDIPAEIEKVKNEFPQVSIFQAPYLGESDGVAKLLIGLADEH